MTRIFYRKTMISSSSINTTTWAAITWMATSHEQRFPTAKSSRRVVKCSCMRKVSLWYSRLLGISQHIINVKTIRNSTVRCTRILPLSLESAEVLPAQWPTWTRNHREKKLNRYETECAKAGEVTINLPALVCQEECGARLRSPNDKRSSPWKWKALQSYSHSRSLQEPVPRSPKTG